MWHCGLIKLLQKCYYKNRKGPFLPHSTVACKYILWTDATSRSSYIQTWPAMLTIWYQNIFIASIITVTASQITSNSRIFLRYYTAAKCGWMCYYYYYYQTNIIRVSLSSLKITSRTFFKVKTQNKMRCAQFGKIKGMTWQKDVFSDDTWRCRVCQMQWRWMAKCSRHAAQRRRMRVVTLNTFLVISIHNFTAWQINTNFKALHKFHNNH